MHHDTVTILYICSLEGFWKGATWTAKVDWNLLPRGCDDIDDYRKMYICILIWMTITGRLYLTKVVVLGGTTFFP